MELRPLGYGEIFDRAITLYIRNFVPFLAMVAALWVPVMLAEWLLSLALPVPPSLVDVVRHRAAANHVEAQTYGRPEYWLSGLIGLAAFCLVRPFAHNAIAYGVAEAYRGRPVSFAACYAASFARWKETLGTVLRQTVFVLKYVALLIGPFLLALALFALSRIPGLSGIAIAAGGLAVLGSIVFFFGGIAALFFAGPVTVALSFGLNAVVIENATPKAAVQSGLDRVFRHGDFWRAFGFALGYFALSVGFGLICRSLGDLLANARLSELLQMVVQTFAVPLWTTLYVVYYYDVRVRREALDLEVDLQRIAGGEAPA